MNKQNLFIFFLFVSIFISCRKDKEVDFRDKYIGEYELYVQSYHWQLGTDPYWLEDTIIGEVFKYDSTINYSYVQNTFSVFNDPSETYSGLTVRFTDYFHSHCYVFPSDTIRLATGYHYHHEGYFKGDSIYFNVTGLGSLGAGMNYYTKGKKL